MFKDPFSEGSFFLINKLTEDKLADKSLAKNPGFLQSVICMLADKAYQTDIVDAGCEDEIGPGEQWASKEDWMNDTISDWFNETSKTIKLFPENTDFKVKKFSIDLARSIYNMSIGERLEFNDNSDSFVMRVPGGWIYAIDTIGAEQSPVFVPYSDEFLKLAKLSDSDKLKI